MGRRASLGTTGLLVGLLGLSILGFAARYTFDARRRRKSVAGRGANKAVNTSGAHASSEEPQKEASGSVTDTSALLAAKVAVPESDQSDPEKLGAHYERIGAKFETDGLNLSAVTDSAKYFEVTKGRVRPLEYAAFQTPLSRGAVRLGVFRLTDAGKARLASRAEEATSSILQNLPEGTLIHRNDRQHYHLTIQMISHPSDPRPDPFVPGGGIDRARPPNPIPGPSPAGMRREHDLYRSTAGAGYAPTLKVHSVVFADSGSLLLLFTDSTGLVAALRRRLRQALPGCAEKQPTILHVTLARVLTPKQLSEETRRKIVAACRHWTLQLRDQQIAPSALWHVQENTFTHVNVDASSLRCPFMTPADLG